MKTLWSAQEVARATGTSVSGEWKADWVSIDSRSVSKGALFVALKGDRFDGHAYVVSAFENGAVAAVVSEVPKGLQADDARLVLVDDTEVALQQLGVVARGRSKAKMVGVTGSVGKTGCKEMLACVLSANGSVYATSGNLNNHLGVPLTLANMPVDCDYAVIEMGMNHAGEIHQLSGWVQPDVSIVTTVEAVHLEHFESAEAIAAAKAEIFDGMREQGVAVLNVDNAHYKQLRDAADKAHVERVVSFGSGADARCRMEQYGVEGLQSVVEASIAGTKMQYRMGAIGKHWGLISVAVLAVVDALGADLPKAAAALEGFCEPEGRGKIEQLRVSGGHLRLIDDCYNASPASMSGAFEKMALLRDAELEDLEDGIAEAAANVAKPRMLAVLGDMLELGDASRELHVGLVPTLVNNQVDLVFAAGSFMRHLYEALPDSMKGDYDATAAGLAPKVVKRLQADDLVLVKGSHGSRMREVVHAIKESAAPFEERKDA